MKTVSTIMPIRVVEIEKKKNGMCDVILITNVLEKEIKNEFNNVTSKQWEYDMYRETISYRDGLENIIENNLVNWVTWAEKREKEKTNKKTTEEILQELEEQQLDNMEVNIDQEARISLLELGLGGGE